MACGLLFVFLPQALQMYVQVYRCYFMAVELWKQSDKSIAECAPFYDSETLGF